MDLPQYGVARRIEEIRADETLLNRGIICASLVLLLKPRLRQNSLRRIPLFIKSATNWRTSARVSRPRAASCCSPFIHQLENRTLLINLVRCPDAYH
jgi:hypothetical protein